MHASPTGQRMAVLRERGVIWDRISQIEAAKPMIRQIQANLFAEPPFRANAVSIANDQHADHQFWIDRGAPCRAVGRSQVGANTREIEKAINRTQQMIFRDQSLEIEVLEPRTLRNLPWSQHR